MSYFLTRYHHELPAAAVAVQDKISALLRMADDAAASMNNELRVQLVKIPKQVSGEVSAEVHGRHAASNTSKRCDMFTPTDSRSHWSCCVQIRLMRLSEFQDKHAGDLTGPALMEIKHRQQALKAQMILPPATGENHCTVQRPTPSYVTQRHVVPIAKSAPMVGLLGSVSCTDAVLQLRCVCRRCLLNAEHKVDHRVSSSKCSAPLDSKL